MQLIEWNDKMSVRVEEIDEQHKKLINMISELGEAIETNKEQYFLGILLGNLMDYAVVHFNTEEGYFREFSYPDAQLHKKEHKSFVRKVAGFKKRFDKQEAGLSAEIMDFLSSWLKQHVLETDMQYADFFNEKGLK
jgi:hemerythrin-like metal-binding protein